MAHPSRRVPSPNPSRYYAVPQSPQNYPYGQVQQQQRRSSRSNRPRPANGNPAMAAMPPRNDLAQGVATGAIGAGYGPYAVRPICRPIVNFRLTYITQSITLPQHKVTLMLTHHDSVSLHQNDLPSNVPQPPRTALPSLSICGIQRIPTLTMRSTILIPVSMPHRTTLLPSFQPEVGRTYLSSPCSSLAS
jgi:hypothetical protein